MSDEFVMADRIKELENEIQMLRASYMNLEQEYKELQTRYEMLTKNEN